MAQTELYEDSRGALLKSVRAAEFRTTRNMTNQWRTQLFCEDSMSRGSQYFCFMRSKWDDERRKSEEGRKEEREGRKQEKDDIKKNLVKWKEVGGLPRINDVILYYFSRVFVLKEFAGSSRTLSTQRLESSSYATAADRRRRWRDDGVN